MDSPDDDDEEGQDREDLPDELDPPIEDGEDDDMSTRERVQRRLLRNLHDIVAEHIANGDFEPSPELQMTMDSVRAELHWR